MHRLWGRVRIFFNSVKHLLWNLSIGPSIKLVSLFILFSGKVSSCPLSLVSPTSPSFEHVSSHTHFYSAGDGNEEITTVKFKESFENEDGSLSTSRALGSTSTSSMMSSILGQILRFLVRNFMGEQWLSEDKALRRLDDLKTSLFNYYARQNLFGGTVEQARDGIGFPSLEGALLSLAFLTFSVFLIDLIQTILNRLRLRTASTVAPAAAGILGRTMNPINLPTYYHHHHVNSTEPVSIESLTTLSSKVISAIEKPWQYSSTSGSSPSSTSKY